MEVSKVISVAAVVVVLLAIAVEAKADHSQNGEHGVGHQGYNGGNDNGGNGGHGSFIKIGVDSTSGAFSNSNSGSFSATKSASESTAISPNNVSIQQPNNSVTTVTNESASAYAPSVLMNSTSPCRVGVGGSGGWIAGSFGIGGSFEDKECSKREAFRLGIMAPDADIRAAAKAAYFGLEAIKSTGVTPMTLKAAAPEKTPKHATYNDTGKENPVVQYSQEDVCVADGGRMEKSRYDGNMFCRRPRG